MGARYPAGAPRLLGHGARPRGPRPWGPWVSLHTRGPGLVRWGDAWGRYVGPIAAEVEAVVTPWARRARALGASLPRTLRAVAADPRLASLDPTWPPRRWDWACFLDFNGPAYAYLAFYPQRWGQALVVSDHTRRARPPVAGGGLNLPSLAAYRLALGRPPSALSKLFWWAVSALGGGGPVPSRAAIRQALWGRPRLPRGVQARLGGLGRPGAAPHFGPRWGAGGARALGRALDRALGPALLDAGQAGAEGLATTLGQGPAGRLLAPLARAPAQPAAHPGLAPARPWRHASAGPRPRRGPASRLSAHGTRIPNPKPAPHPPKAC